MTIVDEVTHLSMKLTDELPMLRSIKNDDEHQKAIDLIENLMCDYDKHFLVIDALSQSVSKYELKQQEYLAFDEEVGKIEPAVRMLRLLMEQHKLTQSDFENEIGKKSMVSQVLNQKKQISRKHINALAQRFDINPTLFF